MSLTILEQSHLFLDSDKEYRDKNTSIIVKTTPFNDLASLEPLRSIFSPVHSLVDGRTCTAVSKKRARGKKLLAALDDMSTVQ
jgi:hypothetical protein